MHHQIVLFLLVVAIISEVGKTWYKPREIIRDDKGVKLKIYIGIVRSKTEHIIGKFFTRADDKLTIVETVFTIGKSVSRGTSAAWWHEVSNMATAAKNMKCFMCGSVMNFTK